MCTKRMSRLGSIALVLVLTLSGLADVPRLTSYQGLLTDADGNPVTDATYQIVFTIYESEEASTGMWYSGIQEISVVNGVFDYLLGSTNTFPDTIFADSSRWLGIRVIGDLEMVPRTRLITVPYSFRVGTVDGATGGVISGDVSIQSDLSVSGKAKIGPASSNDGNFAFVAGVANQASGNNSTISGGAYNTASQSACVIGGGIENVADGEAATVAGGRFDTASVDFATVSGGWGNAASGIYSSVGGGIDNKALAYASTISGGYSDTIAATGEYSYLFGIGSKLTEDSTFMVDMPHIRLGDEATGYEVPVSDGAAGQVMATDGVGQVGWASQPGIAYAMYNDTFSVIHDHDVGTFVNALSVTANYPSSGFVSILATADLLTSGYLALSSTSTGDSYLQLYSDDGGVPFVVSQVVPVASGEHSFYLNVASVSSSNTIRLTSIRLIAVFYPVDYGL